MSEPTVEICQIPPTFESLGLVADLLSEFDSFDHFEFGPLTRALSAQITNRHHVCAFRGKRLVGYCGLLPVRLVGAQAWLRNHGPLEPASSGTADAIALTVVAVREAGILRPLIRYCRRGFSDLPVFFKRSYGDGQRRARKSVVYNRTFRA
ncbi:MAG: hypothetical protein EPO23_02310 [Xanthobacteraceae bacterium]|nr:MAG: hypothetical protein EPO23_02310 [Xanthobacteraceae bacterium]